MSYFPPTGSVVAFQGTNPWIDTFSNSSIISVNSGSVITLAQGSVATVIIGGSIAASFTPPANQSVSGTVGASVIGNVNMTITSIATVSGTLPISGSVATLQSTNPWIITGSVQGSFSPSGNQSVSGTVGASIIGVGMLNQADGGSAQVGLVTIGLNRVYNGSNWDRVYGNSSIGTLVSTASSSVITIGQGSIATVIIGGSILTSSTANQSVSGTTGSSVIGTVPVTQGTTPWVISSVYGNISGSVFAVISGIPNVNTAGSVVSFQGGAWSASVFQSGTWQPSALSYITRNDTVASFLGADLSTRPQMSDSAGRAVFKPFAADESRLDTQTSVVSGSVTALFTSVVGLRQYVTDIMVANTGSVATLITFKDGSTSILGYTIAPANGGSNIIGMAMPFRTAPAQDFVFSVAPSTSILYLSAKGYKAP